MLRPHPKYQHLRDRSREDDRKKLEKLHEYNKKMENASQIWEIKFDELTIQEDYDLRQRILVHKMWVHILLYFHRTPPVQFKQVGIIVLRVPRSLHWMHKHILQQGRFKPLDLNTDVDEYMQHLQNKHGIRYFLKDPPFSTGNPRFVD
jgi:hypothetical protein